VTDAPVTREGQVPGPPETAAPLWDSGLHRSARRRGRRGGGGRGGREGGEQPTVPEAEFRTYYGVPVVKAPVWRHDIPAYLFTGGLAAGSSLLAAGADLSGRPALRRAGRVGALASLLASTYFLIHDLGRPERFHHMLRVVKPTSPMSMGTWILAAYGPMAGAAAASELAPLLPRHGLLGLARRAAPAVGTAAGLAAAVTAPALASYTAVLLADTAIPTWHESYRHLPFVFVGSAAAASGGLALIAVPVEQAGPARRLAVAGAVGELAVATRMESSIGMVGETYHSGHAGQLLRTARALTVGGAIGALVGRRSRALSAVSGAALLAGSLATRFGVYEAGVASAKDPKYVVVPQRERLAARAAESGGMS